MVKLPGESDLGFVRADPSRPGGSFDATPIAAGAAKIAAAGEKLGQGVAQLGAGVGKAGEGLGEVGLDEGKWQYAKAHSDFVAKKIDLDAATGQAQNYGPDDAGKDLPTRYTEQLNAIRAGSANLIQSGPMRGLFMDQTQPSFEQGVVAAQAHARSLSNDAQIAYTGEMGDKAINQAVAAKNDATRTQIIDAHNDLIDGLNSSGAISDVQAAQMKRDWAHQYATAEVLQRSNVDPQGVINELRAKPGSSDAITNRIISIEGEAANGKSSAKGVGQFVDGTWLDVLKRNRPDLAQGRSDQDLLLLKNDKQLARDMVVAYQNENSAALKNAGLPVTPGNLYLSHFLGAGGAKAVLNAPPNMPVADALTSAVGPDQAKAMISANPQILQGQLAGSVKAWADGKMGGASPGGGSIYDMLRPDVRAQLLDHAQSQLQKQSVQDLTTFKQQIEDSQTEASRTGNVTKPLGLSDFVGHLGADLGQKAYSTYQANIQTGKDVSRVAALNPDEMQQLIKTYDPKPGEGYAAQAERQDLIRKAVATSIKERQDDPAGFAVNRLPGSKDAYKTFAAVQADATKGMPERAAAARSFAATTLLEQQGAGVPSLSRQILPEADVERFKGMVTKAQASDNPTVRTGLIGQIQAQKAMWGDYWPDVVRQLTPSMQPMVRAIAAGADTQAMTRLLSLDPKENPAQLLKEQSETKSSDLRKALNTEMAPLLSTMVGVQKDRDFVDYYNLADKLSALYVRDGKDASTAARDAFNALIGNRYDFRDTYRIPKDPNVSADDVQAGAMVAKSMIGGSPTIRPNLDQASRDLNLTPQEQAFYQRHLTNLTGPGGVDNPNGSRSTLYQSSVEHDGKTYNIPTVWNGKILSIDDAVKRVQAEGWDKFPAYASEADAEARYQKMHDYMERDTAQFISGRKANPLFNVKPAVDDVGGLSNAATDSLSKFRRDGVWVTSPDNGGLNLMYGDKAVRGADGSPLFLPWAKLAQLGGNKDARDAASRQSQQLIGP